MIIYETYEWEGSSRVETRRRIGGGTVEKDLGYQGANMIINGIADASDIQTLQQFARERIERRLLLDRIPATTWVGSFGILYKLRFDRVRWWWVSGVKIRFKITARVIEPANAASLYPASPNLIRMSQ